MVFFQLFSNNPDIVRVPAGRPLFQAGDPGDLMYVLTVGAAEVIVNNRTIESLQPGNIIGEVSLIAPGPRSATVIAVTDCEFVQVDKKRFHYLVQQTPFFATQVMQVLAERLRHTDQLLPAVEDV